MKIGSIFNSLSKKITFRLFTDMLMKIASTDEILSTFTLNFRRLISILTPKEISIKIVENGSLTYEG